MDTSQKILSDITVFNKYAKFIPVLNRREAWDEICDRNQDMHIKKYPMLEGEIREVYSKYVHTRKVLPSMRSMQFGGRPIELANNRIFNCAFMAMHSIEAFSETMFLLLGGTGVGFSVQQHHVAQLPTVLGPKQRPRRFLVGDSIEGWADCIKVLISAYFKGKSDPAFDYRDIRPKGRPLITSGGKAPGPDPLRICVEHLRAILNNAIGRQLVSTEVHDMMCHIADAVLAGGIRRAALISLFSADDMDMMSAKSSNWWELNPQRGRANNSVVLLRSEISEVQFRTLWDRIKASNAGEPGIFWTNDLEMGTNPCCVVGDTLVTTTNGTETIKDIVLKIQNNIPVTVICYNEITGEYTNRSVVNGILTHESAKVIELCIEKADGSLTSIKCTPDHKIYTTNRGWVEAQYLTCDDELVEQNSL